MTFDIWEILEIEPTRDTGAIKRAYARLTGKYHPEEEPEKFLQLRKAYQDALRWAEQEEQEEETEQTEQTEQTGNDGWQLVQPDTSVPKRDYAAVQQFVELYTGKQRRNPKFWMDFVTSQSFLSVMREPDFTVQLYTKVMEHFKDCPPVREPLTWLSIAYQYTQEEASDGNGKRGRQFRMMQGAQFSGIESICRLALLGPRPKPFAGNELAMFISFFEYNRLNTLANAGDWSETAIAEASRHIGRYTTAYLHEKCTKREWNDTERHPAGLRLLEQFFRRTDLPEELYRILWQKLDLKSAIFGRSRVLYNALRELVQERVPGICEEQTENFLQLNREHSAYCTRIQKDPAREDEESAALFNREDFQRALRSRRFIEEQLLSFSYWMSDKTGDGFLRRLLEFYGKNTGLPYAEQVQEKVRQILQERRIKQRNEEDRNAPGVEYYERLTLQYRPVFRHWLHTGFYTARDPESGLSLLTYLNKYFPYLPEWSRRFLTKEDGTVRPRSIAVSYGTVEIIFHQRYMEFEINGKPVYQPCLSWEQVREEGGEWFLFLLPLTTAAYSQYKTVRQEIYRRLCQTAAPVEDRELIAMCLAGQVCCIPDEPEEELSWPLELFAENSERLYGVSWYEKEGILLLFEQTFEGRRNLSDKCCEHLFDKAEALEKAQKLLEEAASPKNYDLALLKELPVCLYALPLNAPEVELSALENKEEKEKAVEPDLEYDYENGEDDGVLQTEREDKTIAAEVIVEYLKQFSQGKLRRLELEWYSGELVFVKDRSGYACFFFEGHGWYSKYTWYTMISQPDIYRNVEHDEVKYIPFGMGKLAEYSIFHDAAAMMSKLDLVFMQIGRGSPQTRVGGRWLWSSTTNLHDAKHKWIIARQKLAGFPPNRGRNYFLTKFVFSRYPEELESVSVAGERTLTAIKSGSYGQAGTVLVQFMQKKLSCLRLTWAGQTGRRHLVLFQDNERYMMGWFWDDKRRADFCTADVDACLNGTGSEETFKGRAVPSYLVHYDLNRIRNTLDLMLDDIADPSPVTDRPGEFAPEKTDRTYEEIFEDWTNFT